MNFIDAALAFLDGSARDAEIAEIKRVLRGVVDNPEQHAKDARDALHIADSGQSPTPWYIAYGRVYADNGYEVGETDWAIADETKAIKCVNRIGPLAEQHLVTVARLEADGHALREQVARLENLLNERDRTIENLRARRDAYRDAARTLVKWFAAHWTDAAVIEPMRALLLEE